MDKVVIQTELFPEDSRYHSRYATNRRLRRRAVKVAATEQKTGRPIKDITGQRFGDLTVIEMTDERVRSQVVYICQCDCGVEIKATIGHLTRKQHPITHCGCKGVSRYKVPKPGWRGIGGNGIGRRTKNNPTMAFRQLFAGYRQAAAERGYTWDLTEQQFLNLTQGNCFYCGVEPKQVMFTKPHKFIYNGVDRLDPGKGYAVDNCVTCCGECNKAKMDRNINDFLAWVKRVYKHRAST